MPQHSKRPTPARSSVRQPENVCDLSPLTRSLGFLTRAVHLQEREFLRAGGERALGFSGYSAMLMIRANPGIRQGLLGSVLQIRHPNMVKLAQDLVTKDWIERRQLADRRNVGLWLTSAGHDTVNAAERDLVEMDRAFAAALDDAGYDHLTILLARLFASRL